MSEFLIREFTSPEDGWLVNSYYFETPDGVFLIDTQLLSDYAEVLLDQMKQDFQGRGPVVVYITHPHPDHYGGSMLLEKNTKAVFRSTDVTAQIMEKRANQELANLKGEYGKRLPSAFVKPTETFTGESEVSWKGLTLRFLDLGIAESPSGVVCHIPEAQSLITGDLAFNRVHPRLDDGDIDGWRKALKQLKGLKVKHVFPGHGPPAGVDLIAHSLRYIDHFQIAVDYLGKGKDFLDRYDKQRIMSVMCDKYPDYQMPENLLGGIDLEFARQHGKKVA